MWMRKNLIYSLLKNKIWHLILLLFAAISRKNSRKKGMVTTRSSYSKTRNLTLSEYIYIILSYSIFIERFRLKQKSGLIEKKTCHVYFFLGWNVRSSLIFYLLVIFPYCGFGKTSVGSCDLCKPISCRFKLENTKRVENILNTQ